MRLASAGGDGLGLGAGRVHGAALSLEGVQPVGNFLDICLLFRLVYFRLYLLDLALHLPLIILGGKDIPLKSLNLLHLFL